MKAMFNLSIFLLLICCFTNCSEKEVQARQLLDISITADTLIYINNELVSMEDLESRFRELADDNTLLVFSADSLTHMDAIYKIENIYKKASSDLR